MLESTTIALSEAKTNLCSLVKNVRDSGAEYTIMLRNVPVAILQPVRSSGVSDSKSFGIFSDKADVNKIPLEKRAWEKASFEKYGHTS